MKKFIAIIFCGAMALLYSSCRTDAPCYTLTTEDSLILERYRAIFAPATADTSAPGDKTLSASISIISMDSACQWIRRYKADTLVKSKENAYISAQDAVEILMTGGHVPTGLFLQRGLDTTGAPHWLAWEEFAAGTPDEDSVYVLTNKMCRCKPCCIAADCSY